MILTISGTHSLSLRLMRLLMRRNMINKSMFPRLLLMSSLIHIHYLKVSIGLMLISWIELKLRKFTNY